MRARAAAGAAVLLLALAAPAPAAAEVSLEGFIDVGWFDAEKGVGRDGGRRLPTAADRERSTHNAIGVVSGATDRDEATFSVTEVQLNLKGTLAGGWSFFGSHAWYDGGNVRNMERWWLGVQPRDGLKIRLGLIDSVFGITTRESPTPRNPMVSRSLHEADWTFFTDESLVVEADLRTIYGVPVTVAASLANGRFSASGADLNSSKEITARVGLFPAVVPGLEVGASVLHGPYGARDDLDQTWAGADLSYDFGPFSLRAEYVHGKFEDDGAGFLAFSPALTGTLGAAFANDAAADRWDAWYLRAGWRLRPDLDAHVRYDEMDLARLGLYTTTHDRYRRIAVAGRWRPTQAVQVKAEWQRNMEDFDVGTENDVATGAVVVGF